MLSTSRAPSQDVQSLRAIGLLKQSSAAVAAPALGQPACWAAEAHDAADCAAERAVMPDTACVGIIRVSLP